MYIRCKDKKVRSFTISKPNWRGVGYDEAQCNHCGYKFGVHDTKILKQMFVEHTCYLCKYCGWAGTKTDYNLFGEPRCPNCESGNSLDIALPIIQDGS